uniref:CMCase n=1 Tax=Komagataeibacter xylinus TaxID=28448 RepID=Q44578_KOMXY|nr:CMCase [Komagataeibacter medellinensis NBRC 3288]
MGPVKVQRHTNRIIGETWRPPLGDGDMHALSIDRNPIRWKLPFPESGLPMIRSPFAITFCQPASPDSATACMREGMRSMDRLSVSESLFTKPTPPGKQDLIGPDLHGHELQHITIDGNSVLEYSRPCPNACRARTRPSAISRSPSVGLFLSATGGLSHQGSHQETACRSCVAGWTVRPQVRTCWCSVLHAFRGCFTLAYPLRMESHDEVCECMALTAS